jgi:1-deoxy-D-xylulose-5-phosphate synthase
VSVAHYDMRFLKPVDEKMLHEVARRFTQVITLEDGVVSGGLGSCVLEFMADHGYDVRVHRLGLPDAFIPHATVEQQQKACHIDAASIRSLVLQLTGPSAG